MGKQYPCLSDGTPWAKRRIIVRDADIFCGDDDKSAKRGNPKVHTQQGLNGYLFWPNCGSHLLQMRPVIKAQIPSATQPTLFLPQLVIALRVKSLSRQ